MRFIACSWLGCFGRETRGPLGCAYRKRDVFKREERKKAGKCARGIFVLYDETDEKTILERRVVSIVIGSKDYGSNPKRKEKTSGVITNTRPLSLKGAFLLLAARVGRGRQSGRRD